MQQNYHSAQARNVLFTPGHLFRTQSYAIPLQLLELLSIVLK